MPFKSFAKGFAKSLTKLRQWVGILLHPPKESPKGANGLLSIVVGFVAGQLAMFAVLSSHLNHHTEPHHTESAMDSSTVSSTTPTVEPTVGIVLTGSKGRIAKGIELMENRTLKRLFITGVGGKAYLTELLAPYPEFERADAIVISHQAGSTYHNALQIAKWVREGEIPQGDALVITETLHMPRALYMIRQCSPGLRLHPYPVTVSGGYRNGKMLVREYFKTLYTLIARPKCP